MIETVTLINTVSKRPPEFIREIADAMFGEREFMPLQTFIRKMGMDRKTVLRLIADGLLDAFEYRCEKYRKIVIPKVSFIKFLGETSVKRIHRC